MTNAATEAAEAWVRAQTLAQDAADELIRQADALAQHAKDIGELPTLAPAFKEAANRLAADARAAVEKLKGLRG